jgi:preprotein translocase subunit SecD
VIAPGGSRTAFPRGLLAKFDPPRGGVQEGMNKNLRWKVLAIAGVVALAAWMIYPLDKRIRLGLDLKGGVHLVLRVQTDDALRVETETSMDRIRGELVKAGASGVTASLTSPTTFQVSNVPDAQDQLLRQLGSEIENTYDRSGSGGTYRFTMKPNIAVQLRDDTVNQAIRTIENRINELGVSEPVVARQGSGDQILVQLPGVTDVARAKDIIKSTSLLELKLVEAGPASTREALLQGRAGRCRRRARWWPACRSACRPGRRPPRRTGWYRRRRSSRVAICGPPSRRLTSTTSRPWLSP